MTDLKPPPQSMEAEQSVIGGLLLNYTAFDLVADRVREQDFNKREHRVLYRAIATLIDASQPADVVTVFEALQERGELEEAGGLSYISSLATHVPSTANIAAYADIVRNKATERDLLITSRAIAMLVDGEGETRTKVDKAQELVMKLAEQRVTAGPVMAASVLGAVLNAIEQRMKSGGALLGLSTGFQDLDDMTSGLQAGDLVIIAGRPSMGKTALASNIAEHAAAELGQTVLFFSLEMSKEQIVERAIASLGRLPLNQVRMANLAEDQWAFVTHAMKKIQISKWMLDDAGGMTVMDLKTRARRVSRDRKIGLIVVDYLQLMRGDGANRNEEVSEISRGLKALAKELGVPVIALSQLNRGLTARSDKRPTMSDLRDSGAIEQDADVIMFVYRDEVYNPNSKATGTAEIIIGKQRNGPTGKVRLYFHGEYCRFDNYTGGPIEDDSVARPKRWSGGFDE